MTLAYGLCALGLLALLHTYLIYPAYLGWRVARLPPEALPPAPDHWPLVSVLIAAHNEEAIIAEKLGTVFDSAYPEGRLRVYVGSDASTDRTNGIVAELTRTRSNLQFYPFGARRGKPGVINELADIARQFRPAAADHIFLFTDANVLLDEHTIALLVRHLVADSRLALVDSHLVHTRPGQGGVGASERAYINREVRIKYREGRLWGCMIGPFGGCFALRSTYFEPVPGHFLVDDFYLAMRAFAAGGSARNELSAYSYEAVGERMRSEFRRKARISTGNVQNLLAFRSYWWPPTTALRFAFFSHKILRWLGPFWLLLLIAGATWAMLAEAPGGVGLFWGLVGLLFGLPVLDYCLQRGGLHLAALRAWRYFIVMNIALAVGWWRYFGTEQHGIWEPSRRK